MQGKTAFQLSLFPCKISFDYYYRSYVNELNKDLGFPSIMFLKPSRHRDEATNESAVLDHDRLFFQCDQSPHKTKIFINC